MIELSVLFLATYGFTALALSLTRHQQEVAGRRFGPGRIRRIRLIGAAALVLGFAVAWRAWGFGYGAVMALGLGTIGAALVVGCLCVLRELEGKR